ncbi:hypothetical protein ALO38_200030 [Pseudomonas coronafaciens pv. zizaniae]|nr:hypothetical protein ALO38_200030 [Pseudomonas coronafaciens pv. zizaniae]
MWAKLECLQRTGSFKLRGAYNALHLLPPGASVYTASIELSASASGKTSRTVEKTSSYSAVPTSEATLLSMWMQLVDRVEQALNELQATLQQHLSFYPARVVTRRPHD